MMKWVPKTGAYSLTSSLLEALAAAIKDNPSISDAAAACGVPPNTLRTWLKLGLLPNPEPLYEQLVVRFRAARGRVRSEMFQVIFDAARGKSGLPDPKWAAWVLDHLKDEADEIKWSQILPGKADQPEAIVRLLRSPPPELRKALDAAGVDLVPRLRRIS